MLFSNPATAGAMDWNWMWVRIHIVIVDWFGLGQSASGLCWIGFSHLLFHLSGFSKMDPCPTLLCASHRRRTQTDGSCHKANVLT